MDYKEQIKKIDRSFSNIITAKNFIELRKNPKFAHDYNIDYRLWLLRYYYVMYYILSRVKGHLIESSVSYERSVRMMTTDAPSIEVMFKSLSKTMVFNFLYDYVINGGILQQYHFDDVRGNKFVEVYKNGIDILFDDFHGGSYRSGYNGMFLIQMDTEIDIDWENIEPPSSLDISDIDDWCYRLAKAMFEAASNDYSKGKYK